MGRLRALLAVFSRGSACPHRGGRTRRFAAIPVAGALCGALLSFACGCGEEPAPDAGFQALTEFLAGCDPAPDRTALLVGIDRYRASEPRRFADLEGCENDVRLVKELLIESFGFEERNICVLLNEEATHENIVLAFDRALIDRAVDGTEVFFYLSGHGSRIPNLSVETRSEYDRFDSTYLAHDSRADGHDGDRDLSDDELRCLMTALVEKTSRVTVVTDCCHAGEILRGGPRARNAPRGKKALDFAWVRGFWPEGFELTDDDVDRAIPEDRYVHVAAAERNERAWEYQPEGVDGEGGTHGALTYLLVPALRNAGRNATWRSVVDDVAIRVSNLRPQTVNTRGTVDRKPFGSDFEGAPGFKAERMPDGALKIQAGWLHGLRGGSTVEILDTLGEEVLGEALVEVVDAGRARARWSGAPPEASLEGGLRAIERSRPSGEPPLRVWLEVAELRGHLRHGTVSNLLELVERDADADYRIFRDEAGALRFLTVEGLPVTLEPLPDLEPEKELDFLLELKTALRAELSWRAVNLLASERGSIPVEVSFRTARPDEITAAAGPGAEPVEVLEVEARVRGAYPGAPKRVGIVEFSHSAEEPAYLYLVSIEESRAIVPIYPKANRNNPVEPGDVVKEKIAFRTFRDWPLMRAMRDRYLVLATDQPVDLDELKARTRMRGESARPLPPILRRAFQGSLTRGGPSAEVIPEGWGIAVLDVLVEPPE